MNAEIPEPVEPAHHDAILRNNRRFVHWLSPLDAAELEDLLGHADYARQLCGGDAVLIAYDGYGPYRHKHVDYLGERLANFLYIDRVIVAEDRIGKSLGHRLYADLTAYALSQGYRAVACEVNTRPDNPASHAFHRAQGFIPIGDAAYPNGTALRYYVRKLQ